MSKIIEITPNKNFKIKKNYIPLILEVISLIGGYVLFSIYLKNFENSQNKDSSKKLLYISVSLMIVAIICSFIILINYIKLFNAYPSLVFGLILFLLAASTGGLFLVIVYLEKTKNFCPPGKIFSSQYNLCVNDCPKGSILNDDGFCSVGCISDQINNCPDNQRCINNKCCDETTHEIIIVNDDEECCIKENVHQDKEDKYHCCAVWCTDACCGDYDGSGAKCENGQCKIKCGDKYCNVDDGEACFSVYDGGKLKEAHCDKTSECTIETLIVPDPGDFFEGAYEVIHNEKTFKNMCKTWLNSGYIDLTQFNKDYQKALVNSGQENTIYICGDSGRDFVRFRKITGIDCSSYSDLYERASIQMQQFNFVEEQKNGKNYIHLNIIENPALNRHQDNLPKSFQSGMYSTLKNKDEEIVYEMCLSDRYIHRRVRDKGEKTAKALCICPDFKSLNQRTCECEDGKIWNFFLSKCVDDDNLSDAPICKGDYQDYGSSCNLFFPQCLTEQTKDECPANIKAYRCSFNEKDSEWVGKINIT